MTQEYTPTDEVVKQAACFPKSTRLGEPYPIDPNDFDRWLAAHDAQIRADEHVKALELTDEETSKADESLRKRFSPLDWRCENCGMTQRACLAVPTPCCQLCSHAPEDKAVYEEVTGNE